MALLREARLVITDSGGNPGGVDVSRHSVSYAADYNGAAHYNSARHQPAGASRPVAGVRRGGVEGRVARRYTTRPLGRGNGRARCRKSKITLMRLSVPPINSREPRRILELPGINAGARASPQSSGPLVKPARHVRDFRHH
jgi:hypothetical protein